MVIASIDIQDGKVVQLRQGEELVLERDDPDALIREFDVYGEVAVIDLDAARGRGNNDGLVKSLLRKAQCRVGGGIRTVERARELVSLGAAKIIVGSVAFRNPGMEGPGGEFRVNVEFLKALSESIGRERLIVAVDSKMGDGGAYEIVVDGWKTPTGLSLIESAKAVEPYVSELLFTCVDREGTMTGADFSIVEHLRQAVSCGLTAAGGVSSLDEIEALAAIGCDVQLGMALYTGKVSLDSAFIGGLNWKKACSVEAGRPALLPVIAQASDGQVLMTGFTDREALAESFKRKKLCFYSRSRDRLWMKGETSGNTLSLVKMRADCDRDSILATVIPAGPACHTGGYSCFNTGREFTWDMLSEIIARRFKNPVPGSYTATLDDKLVREKIMEEAEEVCTAKAHADVVWEAADLLYFLTVLMEREKVSVREVLDELDMRHKKKG